MSLYVKLSSMQHFLLIILIGFLIFFDNTCLRMKYKRLFKCMLKPSQKHFFRSLSFTDISNKESVTK